LPLCLRAFLRVSCLFGFTPFSEFRYIILVFKWARFQYLLPLQCCLQVAPLVLLPDFLSHPNDFRDKTLLNACSCVLTFGTFSFLILSFLFFAEYRLYFTYNYFLPLPCHLNLRFALRLRCSPCPFSPLYAPVASEAPLNIRPPRRSLSFFPAA